MQKVSSYETSAAQGCIATGNGSCHHTQHCQDCTYASHPTAADGTYHHGRVTHIGQLLITSGILDRCCCPDKGHQPLGNHSAIEHPSSHTLTLDTTSHHGTLSGMETADGSTGYGNAKHGKDGQRLGMITRERISELRHPALMSEYAHSDTYCHDEHSHAEEGIDASYERTDGKQCGQHVIQEDDHRPEQHGAKRTPVCGHTGEQIGRSGHKHSTHQQEEKHGKDTHQQAHPWT